jgi:hypothetical protein
MRPPKVQLPTLSAGQWITAAVIAFIVAAIFADVITSRREINSGEGPPKAQLSGKLPMRPLTVGRRTTFDFTLDDTAGGAMEPACVGGNLTPEFKVLRVTILRSPASSWSDNRSCGDILETNSTVPVVITVVPLHPGTYGVRLLPHEKARRVGSGTTGEVTVRS